MLNQRLTQLEEQIRHQPQQNNHINNNTQQGNPHQVNKKNTSSAHSTDKGGVPNIPKMIEYIENTMQTLKYFSTQLSQQQDTAQTHIPFPYTSINFWDTTSISYPLQQDSIKSNLTTTFQTSAESSNLKPTSVIHKYWKLTMKA